MEALRKAKLAGLRRKHGTCRKVWVGAMLVELMDKDAELPKQMLGKLSGFLTRLQDRALFGLKTHA